MNDLLERIFEYVVMEDAETARFGRRINDEVKEQTAPYAEMMDEKQFETLCNTVLRSTLTAEQVGFELGVRFAARLIYELLSNP